MYEKRNPRARLDELQLELKCGAALVSAVQECMCESSSDNYSDALFGAVLYLRGIDREMTAAVNMLFEEGQSR